jgi:hypothetical protein
MGIKTLSFILWPFYLMIGVSGAVDHDPLPSVTVNWNDHLMMSQTTTTLQVVVNPLLERKSPIHDQVFESLANLEADYVRYVPWLPYPRLAVAELEPPSGQWLCTRLQGESPNNWNATLSCRLGTIDKVYFASYGTPTGSCGNFTMGKCHAPNSSDIVTQLCVGKQMCLIPVNTETFGDPCENVIKQFAVQVTCSIPQNHTYWNFSVIDPMTEDFMNATKNHTTIINFSTVPAWLYKTPSRVPYPDNPDDEDGSYTQGTELVDPTGTDLGNYYGRLVSWYTNGGFEDEYGVRHQSGHTFDIPYWECLNEVNSEHHNTPQSYTMRYDEMVTGIRKIADPQHKIKFVGLALAGHSQHEFFNYFLNKSNHQPGIPLDFMSYHFYSGAHSRTDPSGFEAFFPSADAFISDVKIIEVIRKSLSPETRTTIDEIGVILPDDNSPNAPMFPLIYWNAAGAMYAYIFSNLALQGIDVLGQSQLVGFPALPNLGLAPQFPSVALLNWTNGIGNARYWVLHMLIHNFQPGDILVQTTVNPSSKANNPFCGKIINLQNLSLECEDPDATISKIDFASYGTPTGVCGNYSIGTCNSANSTTIVQKYCLGKRSCMVPATTPIFGDPCYGTVKNLVVQAECSKGGGFQPGTTPGWYAQGFIDTNTMGKKLLLINKEFNTKSLLLPPESVGGEFVYIDETTTGQVKPVSRKIDSQSLLLLPYTVGVIHYP